jgi:hypothetical protein
MDGRMVASVWPIGDFADFAILMRRKWKTTLVLDRELHYCLYECITVEIIRWQNQTNFH